MGAPTPLIDGLGTGPTPLFPLRFSGIVALQLFISFE